MCTTFRRLHADDYITLPATMLAAGDVVVHYGCLFLVTSVVPVPRHPALGVVACDTEYLGELDTETASTFPVHWRRGFVLQGNDHSRFCRLWPDVAADVLATLPDREG